MTKSLYIHIPFCSNICSYCDFKRIKTHDESYMHQFVLNTIEQIESKNIEPSSLNTIYLGGGTPNYLSYENLELLLSFLKQFTNKNTEFTIECNPEFIDDKQVQIFKQNNVNRISLGVQTLNDEILKDMKRTHNKQQVIDAINLLYQNGINNVSCDFIYNYKNMSLNDIKDVFDFIKEHNIKHISYYALELKENSILTKSDYELDFDNEELQLEFIKRMMKKLGYKRYEISNWSISDNYQSKHNLVYWNFDDWMAFGYGSFGYENDNYYKYSKDILNPIKENNIINLEDLQKTKLMMGLRLLDGFDLNIPVNNEIFLKYKHLLTNYKIDENNHLRPKNIDCLFDTIDNLFN